MIAKEHGFRRVLASLQSKHDIFYQFDALGDNKPSMKQKFLMQADTEQMNSPIRGNIEILTFLWNVK